MSYFGAEVPTPHEVLDFTPLELHRRFCTDGPRKHVEIPAAAYGAQQEHGPHPFSPHTSTLPIPGVTSGMIWSGMNYDILQRNAPIVMQPGPVQLRQPGPSPLQQLIQTSDGHEHDGPLGFQVGTPVKVCHLLAAECARYNSLIGDIVAVHDVMREDGKSDLLFDVRCPCQAAPINANMEISNLEHLSVPTSEASKKAVPNNRALVAPLYGVMVSDAQVRDDERLPPFVMLSSLPSEKLEPILSPEANQEATQRPVMVRAPIWGAQMPVQIEERKPISEAAWRSMQFAQSRLAAPAQPHTSHIAPSNLGARPPF